MEQLINDFSPGLFIMQSILMLVVIFLMVKFAWKPIVSSLDEREAGIKKALESAEQAKAEMENISSANEQLLKEAREEREQLMKEARDTKAKLIADAEEAAQEESAKIIAKAKVSIELEKKEALAQIKREAAQLSVALAEKILKDELSSASKNAEHIEKLLKEVSLKS
ncbi:MAG: F0F1 ATP synthase subunit B [Flavobacteriaceae bacterium]|jgi:F-type H+-transporting ATPase subunit b